jgi:hypothetical protein
MKKLAFIFIAISMGAMRLPAMPGIQVPLLPQVVEIGAVTQGILEKTKIENFIYYAQMVEQQVQAAVNTWGQLQSMIRAEQRAIENLKGIASVGSYSDFMDWYNRQLYLERQVETRYQNIGIRIGGQNYSLAEIEKIPDALKGRFANDEYWDDFTEAQRREMWVNLGLTPANYVYQSAWAARERELAQAIMTRKDMINEENQEAHRRNSEILGMAYKPDVAEKGLLQGLLEITADTNRAIREANYDAAEWREHQLAESRLNNAPPSNPGISDIWGAELFTGPITEGKGRFIERY